MHSPFSTKSKLSRLTVEFNQLAQAHRTAFVASHRSKKFNFNIKHRNTFKLSSHKATSNQLTKHNGNLHAQKQVERQILVKDASGIDNITTYSLCTASAIHQRQ